MTVMSLHHQLSLLYFVYIFPLPELDAWWPSLVRPLASCRKQLCGPIELQPPWHFCGCLVALEEFPWIGYGSGVGTRRVPVPNSCEGSLHPKKYLKMKSQENGYVGETVVMSRDLNPATLAGPEVRSAVGISEWVDPCSPR